MQEYEKVYRQVIEKMTSGVAAFKAVREPSTREIVDFEWILSNAYGALASGRTEAELLGKRLLDEMPDVAAEGIFQRYQRVVETGDDDEFVHELDGALYNIQASKLGDGLLIAYSDITTETKQRRELEQLAERLSVATSAARIGVWEGDPDKGELVFDAIAAGFYGFEPGVPVRIEDWRERIHPDDMQEVAARIAEQREHMRQGSHAPLAMRFRIMLPDGGTRYIQSHSQLLMSGGSRRLIGVNRDITDEVERRHVNEALASRLSIAARSAGIGVWGYNIETGEPSWDETTYRIFGLDPTASIEPDAWVELLHPEDRPNVEGVLRAAAESDVQSPDASFGIRYRVTRPDGALRYVQSHAQLIQSDVGRRLIGVNWDVTEEVEAAFELDEKRQQAEAANVAKSQFLAVMSHEIRTPLNGVLGITALLAQTDLTDEQRSYLQIISRSGDELLGILNDILELSRIEAGGLELEHVTFDLDELLRRVQDLFAPQAKEKGVAFHVDLTKSARASLLGDPTRVRQVLNNLLSNAVKFTPKGEIAIKADVIAHAAGMGPTHELVLEVHDTGVGIAADKLEAIFEPFTQADGSMTRRFGGAGLGLSVASRLAEELGGRLTVESTEGRGSVFTAYLPIEIVAAAAAAVERPARNAPSAPSLDPAVISSVRVLAAEDSLTNQLVLKGLLRASGANATMVENGLQAIEAWAAATFDLILLDIQMPVMDGVAAAREIRRLEAEAGRARTPIIAVSANAMPHQIDAYLAVGMDGHVAKPVKPEDLIGTISQVLETTRSSNADAPEYSTGPAVSRAHGGQ